MAGYLLTGVRGSGAAKEMMGFAGQVSRRCGLDRAQRTGASQDVRGLQTKRLRESRQKEQRQAREERADPPD